jgi:hypothetical protein
VARRRARAHVRHGYEDKAAQRLTAVENLRSAQLCTLLHAACGARTSRVPPPGQQDLLGGLHQRSPMQARAALRGPGAATSLAAA